MIKMSVEAEYGNNFKVEEMFLQDENSMKYNGKCYIFAEIIIEKVSAMKKYFGEDYPFDEEEKIASLQKGRV